MANRKPHGVAGQLNSYVLDVASAATAHGQHKRCVVSGDPKAGRVEVTADATLETEHLLWPTLAQASTCAMGSRRVHAGALRFVSQESWCLPSGALARTFVFEVTL